MTKPYSERPTRPGSRRGLPGMVSPFQKPQRRAGACGALPSGEPLGDHPRRCGGLTGNHPAGTTAPCGLTAQRLAECGFVIVCLSCYSGGAGHLFTAFGADQEVRKGGICHSVTGVTKRHKLPKKGSSIVQRLVFDLEHNGINVGGAQTTAHLAHHAGALEGADAYPVPSAGVVDGDALDL